MPRRTRDEAKKAAKKGLEARLELLIRNAEFKQDLVHGREMWFQYKKAPRSVYLPPDSKHPNYQKWMEQYHSEENTQKRKEMNIELRRRKVKYYHYLAKWDLNWGPWEFIEIGGMDFPSLSPKELKVLFKQASTEGDRRWGKSGPPHMFRLPVIAWDPVALERERVSEELVPANLEPGDGEGYVMSEEELDDWVPGQVGKQLTIELNLTFPQDVLEELVRLNIERVFKRRKELPKRQRLDKIDLQLRVFDLHETGLTFPLITTQFKKRPRLATVKSAYLTICQKINSLDTAPSTSANPKPHDTAKCPKCEKAETFEEMCAQAKKLADQDYKSAPSKTSSRDDWDSFNPEPIQQGHKHIRPQPCSDDV